MRKHTTTMSSGGVRDRFLHSTLRFIQRPTANLQGRVDVAGVTDVVKAAADSSCDRARCRHRHKWPTGTGRGHAGRAPLLKCRNAEAALECTNKQATSRLSSRVTLVCAVLCCGQHGRTCAVCAASSSIPRSLFRPCTLGDGGGDSDERFVFRLAGCCCEFTNEQPRIHTGGGRRYTSRRTGGSQASHASRSHT